MRGPGSIPRHPLCPTPPVLFASQSRHSPSHVKIPLPAYMPGLGLVSFLDPSPYRCHPLTTWGRSSSYILLSSSPHTPSFLLCHSTHPLPTTYCSHFQSALLLQCPSALPSRPLMTVPLDPLPPNPSLCLLTTFCDVPSLTTDRPLSPLLPANDFSHCAPYMSIALSLRRPCPVY